MGGWLQGHSFVQKKQRSTDPSFLVVRDKPKGMTAPKSQYQKKESVNSYLKYSGLAFQLLAAIGIFGWLGYKLDQYLSLEFPVFMLLFGLLGFAAIMVQLYRSLKQP